MKNILTVLAVFCSGLILISPVWSQSVSASRSFTLSVTVPAHVAYTPDTLALGKDLTAQKAEEQGWRVIEEQREVQGKTRTTIRSIVVL